MNIQSAFPLPLGFDNITGNWSDTASLETFDNDYFGQTPGNLHTTERWLPLAQQLETIANSYGRNIGCITTLKISNMWLNRMSGFNTIHPHYHSNSLFSCVVYIKGESGTRFYNPTPPQLQAAEYNDKGFFYDDYTVGPEPNGVVMFPSNLRHTSLPCAEERFTISANFNATEYGNLHTLNQM